MQISAGQYDSCMLDNNGQLHGVGDGYRLGDLSVLTLIPKRIN